MRTMNPLTRGAAVGVLLASLTACGGGVNQLGAQAAAPITLTAVAPFGGDEVSPWATEVNSASKGLVTVDAGPRDVRGTDVEARILDDVTSGAVFDVIPPPRLIGDWLLADFGQHNRRLRGLGAAGDVGFCCVESIFLHQAPSLVVLVLFQPGSLEHFL